jgi:GNAT superfamily N-acetyltransferase
MMANEVIRIVNQSQLKEVNSGFNFDWDRIVQENLAGVLFGFFLDAEPVDLILFERRKASEFCNEVIDLEVRQDAQHQGIGAKLLAQVMVDAFVQPHFEGFVHLRTKTNGVENFYRHLGGEVYRGWVLFDTDASNHVIKRYLPKGGLLR